jgi:hypothetical protein
MKTPPGNGKRVWLALILAAVAAVSLSGCVWVRGGHHEENRDGDHDHMHDYDHDHDTGQERQHGD